MDIVQMLGWALAGVGMLVFVAGVVVGLLIGRRKFHQPKTTNPATPATTAAAISSHAPTVGPSR